MCLTDIQIEVEVKPSVCKGLFLSDILSILNSQYLAIRHFSFEMLEFILPLAWDIMIGNEYDQDCIELNSISSVFTYVVRRDFSADIDIVINKTGVHGLRYEDICLHSKTHENQEIRTHHENIPTGIHITKSSANWDYSLYIGEILKLSFIKFFVYPATTHSFCVARIKRHGCNIPCSDIKDNLNLYKTIPMDSTLQCDICRQVYTTNRKYFLAERLHLSQG